MPYYSSYYRKLLGIDSPSGKPLRARKKKTIIRKRKIKRVVIPKTKPVLVITRKKKPIKKPVIKKVPLRKAHVTYSKKRLGQLSMKPRDIYEKQMVKRIQRKSGMTYIQSMQLAKKARESDVDIEHKVDWKLSKSRTEQYEMGLKSLEKEINPLKRTMRDLSTEAGMYGY